MAIDIEAPGAHEADLEAALNKLTNFQGCVLTRATNQSITHNTTTAVSFSSATKDTGSFWSAGNPTKIIIPMGSNITGVRLAGSLDWAASTVGVRLRGVIFKAGAGFVGMGQHQLYTSSTALTTRFSFPTADYVPVDASAGDVEFTLSAQQNQDSGSLALNLTGGNGIWFSMQVVETS